ncbi:hypothetical protein JL720_9298 [Aureococcus anophagefferens]|nr:hypothetical protein JL720_9298 [Aureococcus anophagefferens]
MKCPNPECGSIDIDWQEAGGDAVCVRCGTVCEESTIVSSIEFAESGGGASSVVGQFVSASCTKPFGGLGGSGWGGSRGGGRPRYGFLRSSRETTLATGRRKIAQVASSLRLGAHFVDGAHRLFGMAAQRNFTQGRKTLHVVCACLYVMCRREKSAHMLIDFSDVLQVNVYALGATFLKFRRLLNLELPIIDPSLYIHRFAAKLELGDKCGAVATTALRVVQRMKRDWIETGRRPAGVCAAALLVGARAHGFHRTQDDVVKALRVCGMTVAKRLADFQATPAAQLSLAEFNRRSDDLAEEHPPSFQRAERASSTQREKCYEEIREMLENEDAEAPATSAVAAKAPIPRDDDDDDGDGDEAEDDFADVADDEIDGFILTDEEVKQKSEIWTTMNKDYLAQRDEKDKLAAARAEASAGPDGGPSDKAAKRGRKASAGKAKGARAKDSRTAKEALIDVVEKKRFSKKINYGVLEGIFGDDAPEPAAPRPRKRAAVAPASTAAPAEAQRAEKRARLASVADETTDDYDEDDYAGDDYDDEDDYGGEEYD